MKEIIQQLEKKREELQMQRKQLEIGFNQVTGKIMQINEIIQLLNNLKKKEKKIA